MQLRYRAICGWLMRAEFSNPVHFHCSLFSYEIYLDSLSTVYTHRLPMVAERLRISRTAPILPERRRSGSVGSTRLDSASRWQAASIEIARNFETFLTRVSYFFFLNLAITHAITREQISTRCSPRRPSYKNSITQMKMRRVTNPDRKVTFLRLGLHLLALLSITRDRVHTPARLPSTTPIIYHLSSIGNWNASI